jgi:hypothetical protein
VAACGAVPCGSATCGGNVVGTWQSVGTCGEPKPANCPDATFEVLDPGEVVVTFFSDGNLETTVNRGTRSRYTLPRACLSPTTTSCVAMSSSSSSETITCEGDINTSCTCTVALNPQPTSRTTYAVNGNRLTLGRATEASFCVEHDVLRISLLNDTSGSAVVYRRRR